MQNAVELLNITKIYDSVKANDNVSVTIKKGSIHAIIGENGAGKTTLMKVLYGMISCDSGKILINGKETHINSPSQAIRHNIGMVHQHFMLVKNLTVRENIIIGCEIVKSGFILDLQKTRQLVISLMKKYNLNLDIDKKIEDLQVSNQQKVEILKLLYRNADILILDEPTAVLTPQETEDLFRTLRDLKANDKTCIIITHKLNEVLSISDYVTVLRSGKLIGSKPTKEATAHELSDMMVGEDVKENINLHTEIPGDVILSIKELHAVNDQKVIMLNGIDLDLRGGEITGIAGVEGNGQKEIIEIITGIREPISGKINFSGDRSLAYIPDDRHKFGMIMDYTLTENVILGRQTEFSKNGKINYDKAKEKTYDIIKEFDVRPIDPDAKAQSLSGGNQQKLVVGREMTKNADLIIINQPTRGLDIKASEFVHSSILDAKKHGKAVLLISADLTELIKLCDRIAVIYNGKIKAVLDSAQTTEKILGAYMLGIN